MRADGEAGLESRDVLIRVALGRQEADLCIVNGRLVNVYSGEILENQCVAISGGRIACVGPSTSCLGSGTQVIDAQGAYVVPGFIDAHAHVDFFANPLSLTPHLLASGTTSVLMTPRKAVSATTGSSQSGKPAAELRRPDLRR